eukprot:CAMPEP_0201682160 /NCGR_PEP_ID=MMETSP0494-20130426/51481_1 /ASSEMBLY_ACC=CAM_ASM_000839 /TAXON_ID=420259 /ORGANISM="Thalassiosira gravida, Strain GMp14c1" /LENGTH=436 /DNA_ID=CAMNT_0048165917 /DNA_START=27 /DNA_END=1337 /DNA_ORIENTATION=+
MAGAILTAFLFACLPNEAASFSVAPMRSALTPLKPHASHLQSRMRSSDGDDGVDNEPSPHSSIGETRRSILHHGSLLAASIVTTTAIAATTTVAFPQRANAALGTLPELSDANAIVQSLTIDVTDKDQYAQTLQFFLDGFDGMKVLRERTGGGGGAVKDTWLGQFFLDGFDGMKVLRERTGGGGGAVKDTWLGFGPETLSIPPTFELPVSSLSQYGGHAAIHVRYDPKSTAILYKPSSGEFNNEPAPGDNVAYLQIGVSQYRISQMVKNGGNVLDAYGWVNVVSPAGLPIRAIVGVSPDPIMFLAVTCADVKKSEEFYAKLGFARQEYPYCRLNQGQGQFEPPQPDKSVYVAPSANSMGILLLKNEKRGRSKTVAPNPVLRSLNVVFAPPEGGDDGDSDNTPSLDPQVVDPSSIPISFISQDYFETEIKTTAIQSS